MEEFIKRVDIIPWRIYWFDRKWLSEPEIDKNKGGFRPCVVIKINSTQVILIPFSSVKSKENWTIEYKDSPTRSEMSYILIDFIKVLDPRSIDESNICKKLFNKEHDTVQAVLRSKQVRSEIREKVKKIIKAD